MEKVVLDASTRAKLNGLNQRLELTDESGNVVGYYLPTNVYRDIVGAEADFSDEEIRLAFPPNDPGRPLADILQDFRSR